MTDTRLLTTVDLVVMTAGLIIPSQAVHRVITYRGITCQKKYGVLSGRHVVSKYLHMRSQWSLV